MMLHCGLLIEELQNTLLVYYLLLELGYYLTVFPLLACGALMLV